MLTFSARKLLGECNTMYHGFFSYGTEKKLGGAAWARDLILEGDG